MMIPRCSVIMPVYNAEKYLEKSLLSVRKQTFSDIEIIAVDDCSRDSSAEIIQRMSKEDTRIRLIRQTENQGAAAARNIGIKEARADYIAFLDSDDLWMPEKLERQFALLQRSPDCALCCTAAYCIDANDAPLERVFRVPSRITYKSLISGNDIVCSSLLLSRSLLLAHPMKKGAFHEDYVCWLEILKDGNRAVGLDEPLTVYRFTPGSLSRNKLHSALLTWNAYKEAGVPLPQRLSGFTGYIVHGIKRYH